ncbi:hypothetical protein HDU87_001450 [Geranomyces variabilis]|uniref:Uncharacterized protein n=1 Tax=Geranomyces variabilis TaxID=109894 RepID=A0AAD5TBM5_9FUNG|nr:hypothetical protein HDU87_001450 [Geranomyces variabilis]
MHSPIATILVISAFASAAIAQSAPYLDGTWRQIAPAVVNCGDDVIVDNFTTNHAGIGETATRDLNQLGGDYGKSATGMTVSIGTDGVSVTPTNLSGSYFFFKFDAGACYDLTSINSLAFDIIAPAGGNFDIGLTQKSPDCHERVGGESGSSDSPYVPLTKYITPNGQKQPVVVPFQDIKGTFDFAHTKDLTMINWKPQGATFVISNIRLRRACNGNGPNGTNTTVSTGSAGISAAPATANSTTSALPAATSSVVVAVASSTASADAAASTGPAATGQAVNPAAQSAASGIASAGIALAAIIAGVVALL